MKILLLGGYGNVGVFLSDLILANTTHSIIIAGRNKYKAETFRSKLVEKYDANKIEITTADASNTGSLTNVFKNADLIINSASTIDYTQNIINALLVTKKDYFDVLMSSSQKLQPLKAAEKHFEMNGQCIITDGGFHPGLPAAMIRYAAIEFDQIEKAHVGSLLKMDWKFELSSPNTITEFISEFKDFDSSVYSSGSWNRLPYSEARSFDFGEVFGRHKCIAMLMEEMKTLSVQFPSLREAGFYISGFNWLTDYFITPIILVASKRYPPNKLKVLANIFKWSIAKFSKPPYRVILQLVAEGTKEGRKSKYTLEISHEDGYYLTAVPAFACLLQYLNNRQNKPGLHFQSIFVDPQIFLSDLQKYGCNIRKDIRNN